MLAFKDIQSRIKDFKPDLIQKYHISYLAIFGSVSRNENTEKSDIDILVDFTQPIGIGFIDLADELESILNSKVDLISRNAIKPKYFEQIKNDLKYV
jgi:predicted nucleotidyltransferase